MTSESDAEDLIERLSSARSVVMSTATLLELSIVMEARLGPAGQGVVERFIRDSEIDSFPSTDTMSTEPSKGGVTD